MSSGVYGITNMGHDMGHRGVYITGSHGARTVLARCLCRVLGVLQALES
jgi:hypothetical protein